MSVYTATVTGRYGTSVWGPFDTDEMADRFARDVDRHFGQRLDVEVKELRPPMSPDLTAVAETHGLDDDYDYKGAASRQHYIDTGLYLTHSEQEPAE